MRYKTYKDRYFTIKVMIDLALKSLIVGFLIGIYIAILTPRAEADYVSPIPSSSDIAPSVSLESSKQTGQETEGVSIDEVKDYIKQIFGNKWRTAWAVAQNECNSSRKEWPVCVNSWGTYNRGEHSVGLFQINIAKGEGKGAWVHWEKIQGETLGEKEAWLSNYKNNILMAYVISQGGTNWNPWTAFTSGNYKKDL